MPSGPLIRYGVNVDGLAALARDLRAVDAEQAATFRQIVKAAATPVADEASANASWSNRIPGSIRIVMTGANTNPKVAVRAGGRAAPGAAALENGGQSGTFRHPVFGDTSNWTDQPARPFLLPALFAQADTVVDKVADGMLDTFRHHGWS